VVRLEAKKSERSKLITEWVSQFENFEQLILAIDDILSKLYFGVKADRFEEAFRELGEALGFASERPDKTWKEGPDNLWELMPGKYLLVEDKNEVDMARTEINKTEAAQMNNSCGWFKRNYPGATSTNIMVIPAKRTSGAAAFLEPVTIMADRELRKLRHNVKQFFSEFATADFKSLPESEIHKWLTIHKLQADDVATEYSLPCKEPVRN
jgi:hypothetical protein